MTKERLSLAGLVAIGLGHELNNALACALAGVELARTEAEPHVSSRLGLALSVVAGGLEDIRALVRGFEQLGIRDRADGHSPDASLLTDVTATFDASLGLAVGALAPRATLERAYDPVQALRVGTGEFAHAMLAMSVCALARTPPHEKARVRARVWTAAGDRVAVEITCVGSESRQDADPEVLPLCRSAVSQAGGTLRVASVGNARAVRGFFASATPARA